MAATPLETQSRWPVWLIVVLLVLVTMALYWPATNHDFVIYDDDVYICQNPYVKGGLTWPSIQWAFSNLGAGFWHPVTWLSILLDCQIYGLRPGGHHLTGMLLHGASTGLLFLALQRMTGARWRSAFVAGLFGWHPLHVESVAWASERKDTLSGFFWMLTLLLYARYVLETRAGRKEVDVEADGDGPEAQEERALGGHEASLAVARRAVGFYLLTLACFVCGLMSKPMLVTLPLMLLLLDWWPLRRLQFDRPGPQLKKMLLLFLEKVPFLAAALVFGLVTIRAERGIGALGASTMYPLPERVQNALLSYVVYLKQTFWPVDLAVYYPFYLGSFPVWRTAWVGLMWLTLCGLLLWAPRRRPYLAAGWIWYVVTLLPMIGLIQVGSFARADRFTYVPLIGVFVALSWGADELACRWRLRGPGLSVAGGAVVVLCLVLTRQQLRHWKDGEALFRHEVAVTQNNYVAQNTLGVALTRKGRVDEALRQYQEAIRLNPAYADAHYNLGNAFGRKGQVDKAICEFQEAIRLQSGSADYHYNLGIALATKGQIDEAINQYREAIRLNPNLAGAHDGLGVALGGKGQIEEAIHQLQAAIRLEPGHADAHYNLGTAFYQLGRTDEAIHEFQEAIRLKPDHAEAHSNLGTALGRLGQTDEAIRQFQEALRLKPNYPDARRNLEVMLATRARSSAMPGASANR